MASGIVLFQGILNVAAHEGKQDSLTTMMKALEKIQTQSQVSDLLAKVKAIANMVENQWKTNVDSPKESAEKEKLVRSRLFLDSWRISLTLGLAEHGPRADS